MRGGSKKVAKALFFPGKIAEELLRNFSQISVLFGEKKIADGGQVDPARDVKVIFCSYILTDSRVPNRRIGGQTFLKFVSGKQQLSLKNLYNQFFFKSHLKSRYPWNIFTLVL